VIDTDSFSARLRERAVRLDSRELLVANFSGSGQESDLTDPPNCGGVGRIRHFTRATSDGWPENSLPIDPASAFLGLPHADAIRAQVFQNAACNWRCWYCYVPFNLLSANEKRGAWVTPDALVEQFLAEENRPDMIDLTGGQPDLVPEWIPWTIQALETAGIADSVYVWSDDNLSNDYFFRYLSEDTQHRIAEHPGYGRVCCFKGFDDVSFSFNTKAAPELFDRQFELFSRLLATGMDLYAYATFTSPTADSLPMAMTSFVDRLQRISESLPLRLIPLEISEYGPVVPRIRDEHRASMEVQQAAIAAWQDELDRRFTDAERQTPINDVVLGRPS
jgi:uncharacterized Fe-S cluster-containing radical SAM superfamily protein